MYLSPFLTIYSLFLIVSYYPPSVCQCFFSQFRNLPKIKKIQIKPNGSICISITYAILFCNHFCRKPLLHVPNGLDSDKIYLIFIAAFFVYRIVSCHLSNIQINPNRSVQPFFCCVFLHCFFYIFQRNVQPGYFQCHR